MPPKLIDYGVLIHQQGLNPIKLQLSDNQKDKEAPLIK